jgi:hypothetical protein
MTPILTNTQIVNVLHLSYILVSSADTLTCFKCLDAEWTVMSLKVGLHGVSLQFNGFDTLTVELFTLLFTCSENMIFPNDM